MKTSKTLIAIVLTVMTIAFAASEVEAKGNRSRSGSNRGGSSRSQSNRSHSGRSKMNSGSQKSRTQQSTQKPSNSRYRNVQTKNTRQQNTRKQNTRQLNTRKQNTRDIKVNRNQKNTRQNGMQTREIKNGRFNKDLPKRNSKGGKFNKDLPKKNFSRHQQFNRVSVKGKHGKNFYTKNFKNHTKSFKHHNHNHFNHNNKYWNKYHGHNHFNHWCDYRPSNCWWWYDYCRPIRTCEPVSYSYCDWGYVTSDYNVGGEVIAEDTKFYLGVQGMILPSKGLGIESVEAGSPAALAGLKAGMIIEECNGVVLSSEEALASVLNTTDGRLKMVILDEAQGERQTKIVQMQRLAVVNY